MPVYRFKCGRCGVEATRVGVSGRGTTSVKADEWGQLCVMAAEARDRGEPLDPLSVSCPYLNQETVDVVQSQADAR